MFRAQVWHIGSGPKEAQSGSTTNRTTGKGRRGNAEYALAVMALVSPYLCLTWHFHWNLY